MLERSAEEICSCSHSSFRKEQMVISFLAVCKSENALKLSTLENCLRANSLPLDSPLQTTAQPPLPISSILCTSGGHLLPYVLSSVSVSVILGTGRTAELTAAVMTLDLGACGLTLVTPLSAVLCLSFSLTPLLDIEPFPVPTLLTGSSTFLAILSMTLLVLRVDCMGTCFLATS